METKMETHKKQNREQHTHGWYHATQSFLFASALSNFSVAITKAGCTVKGKGPIVWLIT